MNDRLIVACGLGKTPIRLALTTLLLAIGIFVFDLNIPLGFAGGVPYAVLVLLSLFSPQAGFTFLIAIGGSLLTVLGYFLSPAGSILWIVLLNRALALAAIWITAILVHQYRSASKTSRISGEALQKSEATLRTVTEAALDAMVMIDHDAKILYWNAAAERMFGYQSTEVIGTPLAPLIIPEKYHKILTKGLQSFRTTGKSHLLDKMLETTARRKDGTEFPIEPAISTMQIAGQWCAIGVIRDITQRKKEIETQFSRLNMEHQRIVQIEKLSALGLMIGEIAHQINNPLVGVVNMAQLALREEHNPENTKELLEDIQNAGEDCHGFLQRMMEFTKISCFDRKPAEIKTLIEDTIDLCRKSDKKDLTITADLPEKPVRLEVDPILIRHALFNLITNAIQASKGGTITVRLSPLPKTETRVAGWKLAVLDEGPGLSEEMIDKIFVPFFTTRASGTGLGLSLVQHVAILHGGQITASNRSENHSRSGAEFTLWLPDNIQKPSIQKQSMTEESDG